MTKLCYGCCHGAQEDQAHVLHLHGRQRPLACCYGRLHLTLGTSCSRPPFPFYIGTSALLQSWQYLQSLGGRRDASATRMVQGGDCADLADDKGERGED